MRLRRYANLNGRGECSPAMLIKHSPQTEITRDRNGGTDDIMHWIMWMDAHSAEWIVTDNVDCLRGATDYETLHNVWRFVRHNLKYRADRPGHERVKSPGALYASGTGDCKSFSIAEGALLRALRIPYKYRFAAYEPGDFTHVYVVATPGGKDIILDAVHSKFDEEVRYYKKKEIRPKQSRIAGPPPQEQAGAPAWGKWLAAGLLILTIFR